MVNVPISAGGATVELTSAQEREAQEVLRSFQRKGKIPTARQDRLVQERASFLIEKFGQERHAVGEVPLRVRTINPQTGAVEEGELTREGRGRVLEETFRQTPRAELEAVRGQREAELQERLTPRQQETIQRQERETIQRQEIQKQIQFERSQRAEQRLKERFQRERPELVKTDEQLLQEERQRQAQENIDEFFSSIATRQPDIEEQPSVDRQTFTQFAVTEPKTLEDIRRITIEQGQGREAVKFLFLGGLTGISQKFKRGESTTSKVVGELIPTTPAGVAFIGAFPTLPKFAKTTTLGTLGVVSVGVAITPSVPKEQRIASGIIGGLAFTGAGFEVKPSLGRFKGETPKPLNLFKTETIKTPLSRTFAKGIVVFEKTKPIGRELNIITPSQVGLKRFQRLQRIETAKEKGLQRRATEKIITQTLKDIRKEPRRLALKRFKLTESKKIKPITFEIEKPLVTRFDTIDLFKGKKQPPKKIKPITFEIEKPLVTRFDTIDLFKGKKQPPKPPIIKGLKFEVISRKTPLSKTFAKPPKRIKTIRDFPSPKEDISKAITSGRQQLLLEKPRQKLKQVQKQKERIITLERPRQKLKQRQAQKQMFRTESLQKTISQQRQPQRIRFASFLRQPQKERLAQPQLELVRQPQKSAQPQIFRQPTRQRFRQPLTQIPFLRQRERQITPEFTRLRTKQESKPRRERGRLKIIPTSRKRTGGLFGVEVRRFGKFRSIGSGLTLQRALTLGQQRVGKTLGATFKITGGGIKGLRTPAGFRTKQEKGQTLFIEKRRFRLSTAPEIREIQTARIKTR